MGSRPPVKRAAMFLLGFMALIAFRAEASEAEVVLAEKPIVKLSIDPSEAEPAEPLRFIVEIANPHKEAIEIKSLTLMRHNRMLTAKEPDPVWRYEELKNSIISPGGRRTTAYTSPGASKPPSGLIEKLAWYVKQILVVPGKYPVRLIVNYTAPAGSEVTNDAEASGEVTIRSPLAAKLWGGAAGALLVSLFFIFHELRGMKEQPFRALAFSSLRTLARFPAGAVTAVVLILVSSRMQDIGIPMNIEVDDFYGGVILGLFSFKLGDWLFTKLTEPVKT